ncbi:MAG: MbtH family protein [Telluria sp.]
MPAEEQNEALYDVVTNHEDQYSIWSVAKPIPAGWKATGVRGSKQTCLEHIRTCWTDMRPRSLREHMEQSSQ